MALPPAALVSGSMQRLPRFVQLLAGATPEDASTEEARAIALAARQTDRYRQVMTFALHRAPGLPLPVRDLRSFHSQPGDRVLLHYGIHIPDLSRLLGDSRYALLYHNITPSHFFLPYSLFVAAELKRARRALPTIASGALCAMAHSRFSAEELEASGARNVRVLPLALGPGSPVHEARYLTGPAPSPEAGRELDPGGPGGRPLTLLFVGRLAPNKGHARLIRCLWFVRRAFPEARLVLAGRSVLRAPGYVAELLQLTRALGMRTGGDGDVSIHSDPTAAQLVQMYQRAHLFVCASEHEGFCVPLIEAMAFGLPIVAHAENESAVAETLGGVGLRVAGGTTEQFAQAVVYALQRPNVRATLIAEQDRRLGRYLQRDPAREIVAFVESAYQEGVWKAG